MTQEIDIAALRKAAQECTVCWLSDDTLLALLDRLEQAEREVTEQRGRNHALQMAVVATQGDANRLREKLEQAEKDAARWRHGAEHGFPLRWTESGPVSGRVFWTYFYDSQEEYQTADDVVDAAMKLAAMQGEGA